MLKVNVGFSRKVSRDYNSTGFSVNLEGEVFAPLDDPEMVIEKIKELYDLAEETLNQQVERYEGESAIASRDEEPLNRRTQVRTRPSNGRTTVDRSQSSQTQYGRGQSRNGTSGNSTPATNKQIQFILSLGKQQGLTTPQLEQRVGEILGREVGLYDLTKKEAGLVLDELTAESGTKGSKRR